MKIEDEIFLLKKTCKRLHLYEDCKLWITVGEITSQLIFVKLVALGAF